MRSAPGHTFPLDPEYLATIVFETSYKLCRYLCEKKRDHATPTGEKAEIATKMRFGSYFSF
jgi:hypothetical protein